VLVVPARGMRGLSVDAFFVVLARARLSSTPRSLAD
jgi:hypothetical protein